MQNGAIVVEPRTIPGANLITVMILDDERAIRDACKDAAQLAGFNTITAEQAEQALRILDAQNVDIVLLDLKLPGASGLEALRMIKERRPNAVVIMITGYATVSTAVQAIRMGAFDYVSKPFSLDELRGVLERAMDELKEATEKRALRERLRCKQGFGALIGRAPEMERLYRIMAKAAQSSHPVLITGESGTGKELVARCIHYSGPAHDKPFIPVDCGSLVPTLIESELFGYVKGAFTGAVRPKDGLLSIAQGGTVFLDEIGELPVELQSKLLRAIQEKEIRPVGGTKRVPINARILAATHRDLEQGVADGTFRRDLYFRLNVLTLRIPPLRDRRSDIPLLIDHFLERLSRTSGVRRTVSDEAMQVMMEYEWPGNVRELENCLERACALSSGPVLHLADLPSPIQNAYAMTAPKAEAKGPEIVPIADLEKQAILRAIELLKGDKLMAAKMLGIGKTTLYRKLKEYAIPE